MLNATQKGKPAFIAIEAPGEDYFVRSSGELFAPLYLSSLVELPQPKVYVFVFSHDILNGDDAYIRAYDAAVAAFITGGLKRGRDRFLLLYSKVKTDPDLQTGITESQSAARAFGAGGIFSRTGAAFRNSPVKDAKIIPYWSGTFKLDTTVGKETRTWPDPEYPAALTEALVTLLRGNPWWRFWA